jgi:hypothetical protein
MRAHGGWRDIAGGSIGATARLFAAVKEVKGQMPVGNGAKVLKHFQTKLKDAGYPAKAADKMFSDYSERELDALFDLSIDEFDKMVEATFNEVRHATLRPWIATGHPSPVHICLRFGVSGSR